MKKIITVVSLLFIVGVGYAQDKEKRINFKEGTIKICSNSHMTIRGYDGDEVVIKNINDHPRYSYFYVKDNNDPNSKDSVLVRSYNPFSNPNKKKDLAKGLKPIGNESPKPANKLLLDITENPGELIIKDYKSSSSDQNKLAKENNLLINDNKYELLIPNTIKLLWNTENCSKKNSNTFYIKTDPTPWSLTDFKGEVEISTTFNSIDLTDVSGPVIANTIGGNMKVIFNRIPPQNLYSLVSNSGYIDVTLPVGSDIKIDAKGSNILSNIDFIIQNETISNGTKTMELQLNAGKTKMKLDSGSGSIYLRKFE